MTAPLEPHSNRWSPILGMALVGAVGLSMLSTVQKYQLGVSILQPLGYVIPVLFGGFTGLVTGYVYERLYQSREMLAEFQRAVDAAGQAVILTDETGAIQYVNNAFESMTGHDQSSIRGLTMDRVRVQMEGGPTAVGGGHVRASAIQEREVVYVRADGERFFAWETVASLGDAGDEGSILVIADITERSIREQQLSVLHRVIRHNLRNELTIIEGESQQLVDELSESGATDRAKEIQARARRLDELSHKATLVQSTLDPRGEMRANRPLHDVIDVVRRSISGEYPEAQIEVTGGDRAVEVDYRLENALSELLINAIEHNDSDQPTVEICVAGGETAPLTISVRDDGPGIPEAELAPLSGTIETQLEHGSGLGLWVVYWVTLYCGGTVDVHRLEPRGTEVRLTVPCRRGSNC